MKLRSRQVQESIASTVSPLPSKNFRQRSEPTTSETWQGWQTSWGPSERDLNQAEGMKETKSVQYATQNLQPSSLFTKNHFVPWLDVGCWSPTQLYLPTSLLDFVLPPGVHADHALPSPRRIFTCPSQAWSSHASWEDWSKKVPVLQSCPKRHTGSPLQSFGTSYSCFNRSPTEEATLPQALDVAVWRFDGQSCINSHLMSKSLGTKATTLQWQTRQQRDPHTWRCCDLNQHTWIHSSIQWLLLPLRSYRILTLISKAIVSNNAVFRNGKLKRKRFKIIL